MGKVIKIYIYKFLFLYRKSRKTRVYLFITVLTGITSLLLIFLRKGYYFYSSNYISVLYFILIIIFIIFVLFVSLIYFKKLPLNFYFKILYFLKSLINKKFFLLCSSLIILILFTLSAYLQYINLHSALLDLGLEQQVVWNTAQGRIMQSGVETANYLGDHFSLITLPVALIYKLFPGVITLFFLQNLALILSGLGVYKLVNLILKNKVWATAFFFIFITYLGISGLWLFDYHPNVFALPFLIWGWYFFHNRKIKITFILFILASLGKEEIGIYIGMSGLLMLLKYRNKIGIFFACYGFLISILALFVFIPYFRQETADTFARYSWLGNSFADAISTVLTNPFFILGKLLSFFKISYLFKLGLPLLFIFIAAPKESIIIIPSLLINMFADFPSQTSALYQYDVAVTAGIFYVAVIGLKRISKYVRDIKEVNFKFHLLSYFIVINFFLFVVHPFWSVIFRPLNRYQDYLFLQDLRKKIPENFIISVSNIPGGLFGEYERR